MTTAQYNALLEDIQAAAKMAEDELTIGFDDPMIEEDYQAISDEFNSVYEDR